MKEFKIKNVKLTKLKNGNIRFERTFVEELTPKEFEEFKKNTDINYVAYSNNIKRLKAQIEATPIIEDDLKELSEKHLQAMRYAEYLYNVDEAKRKLKEAETQLLIQKTNKEALSKIKTK